MRVAKLIAAATLFWACALVWVWRMPGLPAASTLYAAASDDSDLDRDLANVLSAAGFTGNIQQTFQKRIVENLGRQIDPKLVELGRDLWFDTIHSLGRDNTCGGCHSPTNGFGDSQTMAIGVLNNNVVGPNRQGPRNQRRSPLVINTALYPNMMWNSRFASMSGDPFDNRQGFSFPFPEDSSATTSAPDRFSYQEDKKHDITHLLQAQAHMPPTELIEVAGFHGTCPNGVPDPTLGPRFCQFDDGSDHGVQVPLPDPATGSRNEPIRQAALRTLNGIPAYRHLFADAFPRQVSLQPGHGKDIDFYMFGKAIAEFEFTLVFADAPVDRFARGDRDAMTTAQKRGGLLFFGKAGCVTCHAVSSHNNDPDANEMFSDFKERVIGVPQIAPVFGRHTGNVIFAGPGEDEDFGREERTGDSRDRYKFRTAPLRNLAVSPGFFHNGAFTTLEDAIRFHLNVAEEARKYDAVKAGVPEDLTHKLGPPVPNKLLDPLVKEPTKLSDREFKDLVAFVRDGLLDQRVTHLCHLIPASVPSGQPVLQFQGCP